MVGNVQMVTNVGQRRKRRRPEAGVGVGVGGSSWFSVTEMSVLK